MDNTIYNDYSILKSYNIREKVKNIYLKKKQFDKYVFFPTIPDNKTERSEKLFENVKKKVKIISNYFYKILYINANKVYLGTVEEIKSYKKKLSFTEKLYKLNAEFKLKKYVNRKVIKFDSIIKRKKKQNNEPTFFHLEKSYKDDFQIMKNKNLIDNKLNFEIFSDVIEKRLYDSTNVSDQFFKKDINKEKKYLYDKNIHQKKNKFNNNHSKNHRNEKRFFLSKFLRFDFKFDNILHFFYGFNLNRITEINDIDDFSGILFLKTPNDYIISDLVSDTFDFSKLFSKPTITVNNIHVLLVNEKKNKTCIKLDDIKKIHSLKKIINPNKLNFYKSLNNKYLNFKIFPKHDNLQNDIEFFEKEFSNKHFFHNYKISSRINDENQSNQIIESENNGSKKKKSFSIINNNTKSTEKTQNDDKICSLESNLNKKILIVNDHKFNKVVSLLKKKKKSEYSENSLKNGGIKKKYWMNDSYVFSCINCFKIFNFFRRKHHCRFCGQIFCDNCTLVVFYSYYRNKKKSKNNNKLKKNVKCNKEIYNNKLRVCENCYNDVVVYLNDDNNSNISDSEIIIENYFYSCSSNQKNCNQKIIHDSHSKLNSFKNINLKLMLSNLKISEKNENENEKAVSIHLLLNNFFYKSLKLDTDITALKINLNNELFSSNFFKILNFDCIVFNSFLLEYFFIKKKLTLIHSEIDQLQKSYEKEILMRYLNLEAFKSYFRAYASLIRMKSKRKSRILNFKDSSHERSFLNFKNINLDQNNFFDKFKVESVSMYNDSQFYSYLLNSKFFTKTKTISRSLKKNNKLQFFNENRVTNLNNSKNILLKPSDYYLNNSVNGNCIHDEFFDNKKKKINDNLYFNLLEKCLKQALNDHEIKENQEIWISTLKKVFKKVNYITFNNTIDISQYVKIKKNLGGKIKDTCIIDGLYITKNNGTMKMQSLIKNPKIALLMFPIEYFKLKDQFVSLKVIQHQQKKYIENLISRIILLNPSIILVGDSVCTLGRDLLENSGITVISNIKPQTIERISRYTKSYIFQSVNDIFFKRKTLGTCKSFEIKRYVYKNLIKTFLFFTGCDIKLGFTISLRGDDEQTLKSIKSIAEIFLPAYLNIKFEIEFFRNHMISYLNEHQNKTIVEFNKKIEYIINSINDLNIDWSKHCEVTLESLEIFKFIKLFSERQLNFSPTVKFCFPEPLINVIDSFYNYLTFFKRNQKIQLLKYSSQIDIKLLEEFKICFNYDDLSNKEQTIVQSVKHTSDLLLKNILNEYYYRSKIWLNSLNFLFFQLNSVFNKTIHILHFTMSMKYLTPCFGPSILLINYYSDNDKCLGLFLAQIFCDASKSCNECNESILNHYRSYVHGNSRIDLFIDKVDVDVSLKNDEKCNQIKVWSCCKECNYSTPVMLMNKESYYFSFGKFLEQCFYGTDVTFSHESCKHDFFKNHVRYFRLNSIIIRIEHYFIDNYEVVLPKKLLGYTPQIDMKIKIDLFLNINIKIKKFFHSISNKLDNVKFNTFSHSEIISDKIEDLKKKIKDQKKKVELKTQKIYDSTIPTNYLNLNSILRDLQELGFEWESEFNDLEIKILPSGNEIKKITQFQLQNFLFNNINNDENLKDPELFLSTKNNHAQLENSKVNDFHCKKNNTEFFDNQKTKKTFLNKKFSRSNNLNYNERQVSNDLFVYMPTITERIQKINDILDNEMIINKKKIHYDTKFNKRIKNVVNVDNDVKNNRVYNLTNYFNKMNFDSISSEFQKQREQELKKKSIKFKSIKILESNPIVKIYNKIEDAVINEETEKSKFINSKNKNKDFFFNDCDSNQSFSFFNVNKFNKNKLSSLNDDLNLKTHSIIQIKNDSDSRFSLDNKDDPIVKNESLDLKYELKDNKSIDFPQPEKLSILKFLSKLWAERASTSWNSLEYPLSSHEHLFSDSDVIVREDEPTSLVAFCLSSSDYKQKILEIENEFDYLNNFDSEKDVSNKKMNLFIKIEKKFKNFDTSTKMNKLKKIMINNKSNHLKYEYEDSSSTLSCKIFYSEKFEAFRKTCGINESYIQSLSRCHLWNSSGGKSKSNFLKTLDERYVIKELSKSELESFVTIAPFYFKYISQFIFNNLSSVIAKIFGFYQYQIKNSQTSKTHKMDFLVMENLFYNHQTDRIFDLKGSMRNRHVKQTGEKDEVLLDENMVEYIYEYPVFVKEHLKKLLRSSLYNDSSFFLALDIMDYSLVIGINNESKKLFVGIIDWLSTFTWDKKVENWMKGNNLIGGNKKGKNPTILTPKQYRLRFREAIERYILEVPDIWYENSSVNN